MKNLAQFPLKMLELLQKLVNAKNQKLLICQLTLTYLNLACRLEAELVARQRLPAYDPPVLQHLS